MKYTYSSCSVALILVIGCASASEDSTSPSEDPSLAPAPTAEPGAAPSGDLIVELDTSVTPSSAAQAARAALTWRRQSAAKTAEFDAEADWRAYASAEGTGASAAPAQTEAVAEAAAKSRKWSAFNPKTGREYEVELPADVVREVAERGGKVGLHEHFEGLAPQSELDSTDVNGKLEPGAFVQKGWSDGQDTRTRRTDNTAWPYRTIGQINSGCTGTLIGPRHVLTAAHCIWSKTTNTWASSFVFRPGREGTCSTATCEPYGRFNAIWYYTPAAFRDTSLTPFQAVEHDYAIVTLDGRPGDVTGWMGYVSVSNSTLQGFCNPVQVGSGFVGGDCHNRGYPGCGLAESPASCQSSWAYEDTGFCRIGDFATRTFRVGCDIGRGHSGGPLFTHSWNGSTRVVFGVASWQLCTTCTASDDRPNIFRRITGEVLDDIAYFKTVQFP